MAELDCIVVGWAGLTKWSDRAAYGETAETSFYVKQENRAKGIGRALKKAIIDEEAAASRPSGKIIFKIYS